MKKAEPRKLRKAAKPLGDDDLFGDSGDIFSDIPSKPKDKKKKKSSTVADKEDIFAGEVVVGLYFAPSYFCSCSTCLVFIRPSAFHLRLDNNVMLTSKRRRINVLAPFRIVLMFLRNVLSNLLIVKC